MLMRISGEFDLFGILRVRRRRGCRKCESDVVAGGPGMDPRVFHIIKSKICALNGFHDQQ